jgi:type I restriction enzyme S subunit
MITEKFNQLFLFGPKSKIKAGDGLKKGRFPFYTSSPILSKWIGTEQHFDEALIFGTGGSASIHYVNEPFSTSTDCLVAIAKPYKSFSTKFVYYYIFSNIRILEQGFKGAGLKHISKPYIQNLDIPLPDLDTQNKIVAILDKAKNLIEKRERTIQMFDELLRATFLDMFGDLYNNDKKWSFEIIDKLCNVQGGLSITPKRNSNPILMPYLRVANVYRGYLDLTEIKNIRVTQSECERILLKKNDILIVEGHGNINEIGRAALWLCQLENVLHQNHLIRLRINSNLINAVFLTKYLNSYAGIFQMKTITNTTSGLNTVSSGKIKKLKIPIPPIELQNKFEKIYLNIQENKNKLIQSKFQLENLLNGLSQSAFKGELEFNAAVDLEVLLENDYAYFKDNADKKAIKLLLDRLEKNELNSNKFYEQELYDKAKSFVFELLKEEKIKQVYDKKTQSLKLTV